MLSFCVWLLSARFALTLCCCRSAKKAQEEALAVKTGGGSSKIIVPGTPRHTGIGAGARVTATPRRRVGI